MKTKLLALVIFFLWVMPTFAQVDTAWVRRYNGPGNSWDGGRDITVDSLGYVYVTGGSYGIGTYADFTTIKYYPNGDTVWLRRYNGPSNLDDWAKAITLDVPGNVYVTGSSKSKSGFYTEDYLTIKYYPNGDTAWVRTYNGPGDSMDRASDIAVDGFGNVYVTGESYNTGANTDYVTIKYYPNGDTAWLRRYNGPGNQRDVGQAIALDNSNNVYVTGTSSGSLLLSDYATIKYSPDGDTFWVRRYNGSIDSSDMAFAIAIDRYNCVYVTGLSQGSGTRTDYVTIKYYPNGDTVWVRRYNGPGNSSDEACAVAVDDYGYVYVAGRSAGVGTGWGYATIKYNSYGDTVWVRRYEKAYAYDMALDSYGNVYVTGDAWTNESFSQDYATIKYYPNGDAAWITKYNSPADSDDYALAIAVDNSSNVFVTGDSHGAGSHFDFTTIKYHQTNKPPDSFSLLLPPNKASILRVVHFDWETATDPDSFDQVKYDLYVSTAYQFPSGSTTIDSDITTSEFAKAFDAGFYYWKVKAKDNCGAERWCKQIHYFMVTGIVVLPADFNADGLVNLGDVTFAINYLYKSGPAPDPMELGDVNCDRSVDLGDLVYLISYLYKGGPPPGC